MKLRTQLIFLSLLTLSLPWAGCEYIREMETTLRQGQAQNLLTTTRTIAHLLSYENPELFSYRQLSDANNNAERNVFAHALDSRIVLDGYNDDWGGLWDEYRPFPNQLDIQNAAQGAGFVFAANRDYVYLFAHVRDDDTLYYDPAAELVNGDRLQLLIEDAQGQSREYYLMSSAPGKIIAQYIRGANTLNPALRREPRVHGQWQDTSAGFNIEIRIPRSLLKGHFSFALVDEDSDRSLQAWYGTWQHGNNQNDGLIVEHSAHLQAIVEKFKQNDARIRVTSQQGWLLSSVGSPSRPTHFEQPLRLNETLIAFLNQLYHFIMYFSERTSPAIQPDHGRLRGELMDQAFEQQGATAWYKPSGSNRAIVSATFPVTKDDQVIGVVVADQSSDAILTLTNYALNRLITISSISILLAAGGLLGYATYLSVRIRRLRNATDTIITPEGKLSDGFVASRAGDELGDLSRSFAVMHQRLQEYTQYLRSLASKLSHELRTPLAVVQSSLDNLDAQPLDDNSQVYLNRAREGSERLGRIITALSEASRVEQSIAHSEQEVFDLRAVLASAIDAYRDAYPEQTFQAELVNTPCMINGSPDLLLQMLDKLIDNAVDFSENDTPVVITLHKDKQHIELRVANQGPRLPEHMQHQLFDSMVSVRAQDRQNSHLGLGLFIVKLISDAHRAQLSVRNLDHVSGVEFIVRLPTSRDDNG